MLQQQHTQLNVLYLTQTNRCIAVWYCTCLLKMVQNLNFRHRGDKTLKSSSSHIILPKTQLCALVFFSRSLNERNMGPNDGTNGSFPPSFQEHGVAPSSGALRRRALCFAKWSNCFLTRLALKQKCKSVPNHVQPAGF